MTGLVTTIVLVQVTEEIVKVVPPMTISSPMKAASLPVQLQKLFVVPVVAAREVPPVLVSVPLLA